LNDHAEPALRIEHNAVQIFIHSLISLRDSNARPSGGRANRRHRCRRMRFSRYKELTNVKINGRAQIGRGIVRFFTRAKSIRTTLVNRV
jgi:hypothetical protein